MADVVCFGEIMLRLTTPLRQRFGDAAYLDIAFGGAEANAAVQMAQLGASAAFVTRLPENDLGSRCVETLLSRGVDVSRIQRGPGRMGLYFVEPGAGLRSSKVTYDRAHSTVSMSQPGMFDWDAIFAGAKWFHWSGITPALSEGCAAVCREACEAAKARGLSVSFDVNFRAALWSDTEAAATFAPLMQYVDLCVCGEDEAVRILGAETLEDEDEARLPAIAASLARLHGFRRVAMTSRHGASADRTVWRAMLMEEGRAYFSRIHEIDIADRVGSGDAFTGALIFSLLRKDEPGHAVEFASAAGAWKHEIPGDWNRATVEELEELAKGEGGGRIRR
jgi:2-dehydro-3-deoxygluconokinase